MSAKLEVQKLRKELGIDDYLELVKEDRNCNGAYVSFGQYMYLLEQENQELKNQLNDYKNRYKNYLYNKLSEDIEPDEEDFYLAEIEGKSNEYDELIIKQKEFIEYLENEIKRLENYMKEIEQSGICHGDYPITYYKAEYKLEAKKKILSKYKEIIGVSDENNT